MIIDGNKESENIREQLAGFIKNNNLKPKLVIVRVGNDIPSGIYIDMKQKRAAEIGIDSEVIALDENVTTDELVLLIKGLNCEQMVNGIIVQMPLPVHIDKNKIVCTISPEKDVDGFHPENLGKLMLQKDGLYSCTAMGCLHLIKQIKSNIAGLNTVVIGRSIIVGRPVATMLLNENASVSILHSHTYNLADYTRNADIIVACTGMPGLIKQDMVKKDVIIIDVGVFRQGNGKIIGDTDFDNLKDNVFAITPPIGGVGPMTVAMLMYNTVKAHCAQNKMSNFSLQMGII